MHKSAFLTFKGSEYSKMIPPFLFPPPSPLVRLISSPSRFDFSGKSDPVSFQHSTLSFAIFWESLPHTFHTLADSPSRSRRRQRSPRSTPPISTTIPTPHALRSRTDRPQPTPAKFTWSSFPFPRPTPLHFFSFFSLAFVAFHSPSHTRFPPPLITIFSRCRDPFPLFSIPHHQNPCIQMQPTSLPARSH